MRDAVLHLISNKSGSFNIPCFPAYSDYTPYEPTAQETVLRDKLLINMSSYHLINSMLAVYSFSDILSDFRESSRTFNFNDLPISALSITNATYANTETENFNIVNVPNTFPSANYFNWSIKCQDSEFLIFSGCDISVTIPYTLDNVTQDAVSYRILTAGWPTIAGIKGGFALDPSLTWSFGDQITLTVPPVTFPYDKAIDYINILPETAQVLSTAGLARNYYNAQSDIEKYALLMLAISRPDLRNPASQPNCK
jgi:hypothetical protein